MSIRQHPDFLRIWSGQVVSNIGDGVHRIAVLWWARQATGSDLAVVAGALATVLPSLAAAPLAGWLVDRWPKQRLLLASEVIRLVASLALAALYSTGNLALGGVLVIAALAAVGTAVFDPALMSSVTTLVSAEARPTANSMIGGSAAVAGIVGPALGGLLIGVAGTGAALWLDAATFAVSIVLIAASRVPAPVGRSESGMPDDGVWAGWHLVRRDREVRDLVVVAGGLNLCAAPVPVLVVGLAAGPLGLGGRGFGLLEACVPAGVLAGLVLAPRLVGRPGAGRAGVLATGLGIAAVGLLAWWPWAALWLFVGGAGVGVVNALLPTRFQSGVAPELQGRVFALVGAISQLGRPIGLLLAAPLVAGVGVQAGIVVCGLSLAAIGVVGRRGLEARPARSAATGAPAIAVP